MPGRRAASIFGMHATSFWRLLFLMACGAAGLAQAASDAPADPAPALLAAPGTASPFPRPAVLEPAVAFWRKVFSEYSENQLVLHSIDYPQKVFTVLDYRDEAAAGVDPVALRKRQRLDEKAALSKIDAVLEAVHRLRRTPEKMNAEQQAVYELFADIKEPDVFKSVIGRVRSQRGLKERTAKALETSGKYLPHMEQVFRDYGLPVELTRLPLVESSFNVDAYSKVGAAGLWQFMPASARIYMRLDEIVDDRRDPWFSTVAAAKHLKDDFEALQNWPLAVTAYNYGRVGIARALKAIKGDSLTDMLERFDGKRFGFASRNFYAEFLAAVDVERDYQRHFGVLAPVTPLDFDVVETADYVSYDTLRGLAGLDEEMFRRLNPAYRPEVIEGKLFVPPNHPIRVAAGRGAAFKAAYSQLGTDALFDHQREYWIRHRVTRGETLGGIARHYRVSLKDLQSANAIRNPRTLRIGQIVKVPPRDRPATGRAITVAQKSAKDRDYRLHRIERGQTLSGIARRYDIAVRELVAANGLDSRHDIRAGELLKVPVR